MLVGRDVELAALRSSLEATAQGSGGCDVLAGQPGIGKSRLIEEARLIAGGLGITVAAGGAIELDRVAPARTLTSALRDLGGQLAALGRSPADGPGEPALPYIDDLAEALDRFARSRPLLVAIDDMQWADELSALALRILVPTLAASPVRWLLARRPVPARTAGQDTVSWLVSEGARELYLGRLSEDAVKQLCSDLLGATADATVLALTGRARGNPFLIEQLLKAMLMSNQILISDGLATVTGSELPLSFLSAVDQRLRGLPEAARRLLETGSVFGRAFTVHEAAQLAGVAPPVMAAAAAEALSSGLLVEHEHRLDFAHDLLRQAGYDHTPKPVRAAMHREAAAALRTRGGAWHVEVAEHLIRGGDTGDREAVDILRVAARDVAGRAPGAAADLIVRAVSMLDEQDPARSELSAEAVSLLASAGRLVEAQQAGEVALRGDLDGPVEAKALCGLAEALKHAGHNAAAAQYARRGLARPGVPDDLRARLQAVAAHALLWERDMAGADRAGACRAQRGRDGQRPAGRLGGPCRSRGHDGRPGRGRGAAPAPADLARQRARRGRPDRRRPDRLCGWPVRGRAARYRVVDAAVALLRGAGPGHAGRAGLRRGRGRGGVADRRAADRPADEHAAAEPARRDRRTAGRPLGGPPKVATAARPDRGRGHHRRGGPGLGRGRGARGRRPAPGGPAGSHPHL